MRACDFAHRLIGNYNRFSRSFGTIRSSDLHDAISGAYDRGRLLSLRPHGDACKGDIAALDLHTIMRATNAVERLLGLPLGRGGGRSR